MVVGSSRHDGTSQFAVERTCIYLCMMSIEYLYSSVESSTEQSVNGLASCCRPLNIRLSKSQKNTGALMYVASSEAFNQMPWA